MNKVNYDQISQVYDDVREEEVMIINNFLEEVTIEEDTTILDIGCGTGNYTNILQRLTGAKVFGLDPSQGMLAKAREKNRNIVLKVGSATNIPFLDNTFDFIYMTDVIHHITDRDTMFKEIHRVLKQGGKACIVTQSHGQIDKRYMTEFFPETGRIDKERYPDINDITGVGEQQGLTFIKVNTIGEGDEVTLGSDFLKLIEKKGYSMLHLIRGEAYEEGLLRVKKELQQEEVKRLSAGATLVWLLK